jgi:glycosyltransferase involved in cell wall biosynthesis
MTRILVATDAWHPQVNGVVRSLEAVAREAPGLGAEIVFLTPAGFHSLPLPTYPDIRLSLCTPAMVGERIGQFAPDYLHIATEGPIGWSARRHCLRLGVPFTTSYHTRFPEYLSARLPVPESASYALLRQFHNAACGTMAATVSLQRELEQRGFRNVLRWSRGVDTALFRPREARVLDLPRPIFLYVGRIAVEKNIEAFLALDLPGSKVVVGEGPQREALQMRYRDAHFLGLRVGEALAEIYASSDVFVFPSRTDTFGIVLLEALACGLPVAAYPVAGPRDAIAGGDVGVLDEDLRRAALAALTIPAASCRSFAMRRTWRESARQFVGNVVSAQRKAA